MNAHDIEKIVCHRCFAVLDLGDNYCRYCGTPTVPAAAAQQSAALAGRTAGPLPVEPRARPGVADNPWAILAMLFVFLGPLALPMLWRSRSFNRAWKTILTILVVLFTAAVTWLLWHTIQSIVEPLRELREIRKGL